MEQRPKRTEGLRIRSQDVDSSGTLKLQSLFGHFQEIAGNHAAELGVGYDELEKKGCFWVLSRIRVHIERMPAWRETVSLETWPKHVDRLFALRDFQIVDAQQNSLLTGTTAWLVLDRAKNRPQRLDVLPVDIQHYDVVHAIEGSLDKLKPGNALTLRHEHTVLASELDMNNHVNNTEYTEWIADCFGHRQMGKRVIRSIQINYLEEALFGDTIGLYMEDETGKGETYYIEGISRRRGSKVFQAIVHWG